MFSIKKDGIENGIQRIFKENSDAISKFIATLLNIHRSGDTPQDVMMCTNLLMRFFREWTHQHEEKSKDVEDSMLNVDVVSEYFGQRGLLTWKCLVRHS